MANINIELPLNRVAVIDLYPIGSDGEITDRQITFSDWLQSSGSDSYFSMVISADGMTGEIHPIATGNGSIQVSLNQGAGDTPSPLRTIAITVVPDVSSESPVGEYAYLIGTPYRIVAKVGRII